VRICRTKIAITCLPYENPKRYPTLTQDDGILWLDERLTERTQLEEIAETVSKQARAFFKVARPVLLDLAHG
jgi:hypothetical protein